MVAVRNISVLLGLFGHRSCCVIISGWSSSGDLHDWREHHRRRRESASHQDQEFDLCYLLRGGR
ncbi:UNVERIFIED_CONTAM: hypothetical protein GTU68_065849, partial [Idotea baltica]|nr:hypothetical protein [Idotea baltica]